MGRYTPDGRLVIVAHTVRLSDHQAAEVARVLRPLSSSELALSEHPWPARIRAGYFGGSPVDLLRVDPVHVVEIAVDNATQSGGRHRHPARFLRLPPDLEPSDVDRLTIAASSRSDPSAG